MSLVPFRFVAASLVVALCVCTHAQTSASTHTDFTKLPVGDGRTSATTPAVGVVFTCRTEFIGADRPKGSAPWIDTETHTFDFAHKPTVQGDVAWPAHKYAITLAGPNRIITTNDLPNHTTGTFPIAFSDPAHKFDGNPNAIATQTLAYSLPANPVAAASPQCTTGGPIGFLLTGVVLYNGLDADGRDAVAHEVQDHCQGHPQRNGEYHYHNATSCLPDPGTGHSNLLGYALDGFGIYGVRGEDGKPLTDADLDVCHGHTHEILWDGKKVVMYHYHATSEYPYTLGCFHGTPVRTPRPGGPPQQHHPIGPTMRPDAAASTPPAE